MYATGSAPTNFHLCALSLLRQLLCYAFRNLNVLKVIAGETTFAIYWNVAWATLNQVKFYSCYKSIVAIYVCQPYECLFCFSYRLCLLRVRHWLRQVTSRIIRTYSWSNVPQHADQFSFAMKNLNKSSPPQLAKFMSFQKFSHSSS